MIARYPIFRERLAQEWQEVRRAAERALHTFATLEPDSREASVYLDSVALNLHAFYNGLENIFAWLARQVDRTMPEGPSWHRDLLRQMSLTVPEIRPPVIRPETGAALEEFLGFRHVVRNLYTWELEFDRISDLIEQLPDLLQMLETDFEEFRGYLDAAARADEV